MSLAHKSIPEIALNFLFKSENSTFRESIFKSRFKYDFQIAAAHNDEYLFVYERELDRHGVDLIMEFKGAQRPVQLKTIVRSHRRNSSTKSWEVNSKLLRPQKRDTKHCLQDPLKDMLRGGLGGVLIVQEINWEMDDTAQVKYHYFDYTMLDLILDPSLNTSILKGEHKKLQKLESLRQRILVSNENIKIPLSFMMDVEGEIDRILSFMGFETYDADGDIFEYIDWIRSNDLMRGLGLEALQRILSRNKIPDSNF